MSSFKSSNPPPVAGEVVALYDNLHRLCAPNPGPMTGQGTNTYIYGDKELAVFDAGPADQSHIDRILSLQDELNAPITRLICTHTHTDHSPAVQGLIKALDSVDVIGLPAPSEQPFEDTAFSPSIHLVDGQTIDLGCGFVRAIHTPGHVSNHYCFLIEEHNALIAGDQLMNGSTVVIIPPQGDMKDYVESLNKLLEFDIAQTLPAHGSTIDDTRLALESTLKHRLAREAKVLNCFPTGKSIDLESLVENVYDDVDPKLHPIAALSLQAHLDKLLFENRVTMTDGNWKKRE